MADPQDLLPRVPKHGIRMLPLLPEDTSTIFDSEITADTSPGRYVTSHASDENATSHYEEYAQITGFDVDHTNSDDLTFPGFRPMRDYLTTETARYLVSERRWSREDDHRDTVGQKNVIIIFVCIATVEDCLVDDDSESLLPVNEPFDALMDLLGMRDRTTGKGRTYEFLSTIRRAFVKSRSKEIEHHLANGIRSPPEPIDLSGLGKMLLDVMDRHIAFLLTKKPLTRLGVPFPSDGLLKLRLMQIKKQLHGECIEQCFKTFVPTIPADKQTSWPRGGMAAAWEDAQAKLAANQLNVAVDAKPSKQPEYSQSTKQEAPTAAHKLSGVSSDFTIPGIPADGPVLSLQTGPNPSAGHPDVGPPGAVSGLQLFKTAAFQVHKVIGSARDGIEFRDFIGRIEDDVQKFHAGLQAALALPVAGPVNATGIHGSELDVLLERQHIRSLMNIGLGLIRDQWNEQYVTDDFRQKILVDIKEELRKIEEAADQVCSLEV